MDEGFEFDTPASKSRAKKGRRARNLELETGTSQPSSTDEPGAQPRKHASSSAQPSRRRQGWGMADAAMKDDPFDSRLLQDADDESTQSGSDVQAIPDLDEIYEEDFTQEIASAPAVAINNMATYRELDVELMNQSSFRTLDGAIDLKALVKSLPSEKEVREEQDVCWEWEKLFAEVTSALKGNRQEAALLQKSSQERIV